MALFDRRLLAYFDDAGIGAGGTTLLERIKDYQRDLAEIERELSKYQTLLGSHQVKIKHRDRNGWIDRCNDQKSIKERYRPAIQAMAGQVDAASDAGRADGNHDYGLDDTDRSLRGRRASKPSRGSKGSDAMTLGRNSTAPSERPRPSTFDKVGRASVPGSSGKRECIWVQIDTIANLPPPRSPGYIVRACWQGHSSTAVDTEVRPLRTEDGEDKCIVRQQLKLEVIPGARTVTISVHRRDDSFSGASQVGEVHLDIFDSYNLDVQVHPLTDNGRTVGTSVNMRLTAPEGLAAPVGATKSGGRPSARFSLTSSSRDRGSLAPVQDTPNSDASTPAPSVGAGVPPRRRSSGVKDVPPIVHQPDPATAPRERPSMDTGKGVAPREVTGAAAAKALATPASALSAVTPSSPGGMTDEVSSAGPDDSVGDPDGIDGEEEGGDSEPPESEEGEEEEFEEDEEEEEEERSGDDG